MSLHDDLKANARPDQPMVLKLPHGPEVDLLTLELPVIHRLAQYGARPWVQDAIAGLEKEMKAEGATDADIAAAKRAEQEARWAAILDGTVGTRTGGPRVRGIDKVIRDIAVDRLRAGAARFGQKLPKGEAYQKIVNAYISKHIVELRAEAERRMAEVEFFAEAIMELLGE